MSDFAKYLALRDAGPTAATAYSALRNDGLGQIDGIRMLREVYLLSLIDAKTLAHEIETGESAQQREPGLEKKFTDVLDEFFGDDD